MRRGQGRRGRRRALVALAIGLGLTASAETAGGFKVVVHPENPTASLSGPELSAIFLKSRTRWEDGERILPADLSASSEVRREFTLAIHGMPLEAVMAHWQQEIFSGRSVPPPVKADDVAMIEFVRSNPGAIGYVSSRTSTEAVRELPVE